jgi:predicted Zn finger-like uncharacterized protein
VKISCPQCAAKYSIADEKVQDRLAKIRCRKCGTTIVIDGKSSPPNVYAADGASAPSASSHEAAAPPPAAAAPGGGTEYSVDFGDNDQRTLTVDALVDAYNGGEVTAETYVWTEGMADWAPLGEVPEIVEALHASAGGSEPAQPSAPVAAPVVKAPVAPEPAPAPVVSAPSGASAAAGLGASVSSPWGDAGRAAARAGARAPAADLFGRFDTAGSEEDVTTSAAQNAAPAVPQPAATGARNESSVLFSLSALTASAPAASPSRSSVSTATPSSAATREDSGLIDLKALTSSASASEATSAPVGFGAPLMAAPLGIAAPLGGGIEAQVPPSAATKNRAGLFIVVIAIAALAIIATIIVTSRKAPAPAPEPSAAAAVAPPAPTQSAAASAAPQPSVAAEPPATGTAEEASSAKPGEKTAAHHYTWHGHASKSSGSTSSAVKSTPTKHVVHHSACGCAPGDLECAMRCAAR